MYIVPRICWIILDIDVIDIIIDTLSENIRDSGIWLFLSPFTDTCCWWISVIGIIAFAEIIFNDSCFLAIKICFLCTCSHKTITEYNPFIISSIAKRSLEPIYGFIVVVLESRTRQKLYLVHIFVECIVCTCFRQCRILYRTIIELCIFRQFTRPYWPYSSLPVVLTKVTTCIEISIHILPTTRLFEVDKIMVWLNFKDCCIVIIDGIVNCTVAFGYFIVFPFFECAALCDWLGIIVKLPIVIVVLFICRSEVDLGNCRIVTAIADIFFTTGTSRGCAIVYSEIFCTLGDSYFIAQITCIFCSVIKHDTIIRLCIGIRFHQISWESFTDRCIISVFFFEELYMDIIPAILMVTSENNLLWECHISYTAVSGCSVSSIAILECIAFCTNIIPNINLLNTRMSIACSSVQHTFCKCNNISIVIPCSPALNKSYRFCTVRWLNLPNNIVGMSWFIIVNKTLPNFIFAYLVCAVNIWIEYCNNICIGFIVQFAYCQPSVISRITFNYLCTLLPEPVTMNYIFKEDIIIVCSRKYPIFRFSSRNSSHFGIAVCNSMMLYGILFCIWNCRFSVSAVNSLTWYRRCYRTVDTVCRRCDHIRLVPQFKYTSLKTVMIFVLFAYLEIYCFSGVRMFSMDNLVIGCYIKRFTVTPFISLRSLYLNKRIASVHDTCNRSYNTITVSSINIR